MGQDMSLASRIKDLRTDRGLSQAAVASGIGVKQPSYHALESGETTPSLSHLIRLARFYDLPVAEAFPDYEPSPDELLIISEPWRSGAGSGRLAEIAGH